MATGMSLVWIGLGGGPATLVEEKTGSGQSGTGVQWLCACFGGLWCDALLYVDIMK